MNIGHGILEPRSAFYQIEGASLPSNRICTFSEKKNVGPVDLKILV
jgi:hypothetical protein